MAVAISAQIHPRTAGGVESNLFSMLRSEFWNEQNLDLKLLALPPYARELSEAIGHRLPVVSWELGEELGDRTFPRDVSRGRFIRERLNRLRPAFDAAVLLYRVLRHGRKAPSEEKVDRVLRRLGVRAVHFPTSNLFRTNMPFVYEPWDLQFLHFPDFFDPGEIRLRRIKYTYGCTNSAIVVTPTRWVKDDLVSRLNIDPKKIAVVRRGSDFAVTKVSDAQYMERLCAWGLDPGFAFYPAMTFPHKNHLTLLRALAHLKEKKGLRIPLVMTGRRYGSYWPVVEKAIAQKNLGDQVRVLGSVPELTLAALYRGAHAVVFPSVFEGLGLPLLEALRHGTPVIAARASCIPEVVGRAGILFDPTDHLALADVLERAWLEPGWVRQPLQHAPEQLELFSWGKARKMFGALYRKIGGKSLSAGDQSLIAEATS